MQSAFGVEHGGEEISKLVNGSSLRDFARVGMSTVRGGARKAGAHKASFSLKSLNPKSTGGARKAGVHAAGRRSTGNTSWSPFQTGGTRRYQGRHL